MCHLVASKIKLMDYGLILKLLLWKMVCVFEFHCFVFQSSACQRVWRFVVIEYIVLFDGYYTEPKRIVFVSEALSIVHLPSWELIPRNNPARQFPSDFSLIKVSVYIVNSYPSATLYTTAL